MKKKEKRNSRLFYAIFTIFISFGNILENIYSNACAEHMLCQSVERDENAILLWVLIVIFYFKDINEDTTRET